MENILKYKESEQLGINKRRPVRVRSRLNHTWYIKSLVYILEVIKSH